jgi:hypothetical protein
LVRLVWLVRLARLAPRSTNVCMLVNQLGSMQQQVTLVWLV